MTTQPARPRRPTTTQTFGASRRESHDASIFYGRFVAPELSADSSVVRPSRVDYIETADARSMTSVESGSIALVVTSPPYFAGKDYETALGQNGIPATYLEYLQLLSDVFAECKRVLEPGGRIAVNVANLGRRPYRSLSGDVTHILQNLGLLMRGEVVWWKGRAAGGSCAWGSFQSPANPVLRDVTERVVIASKGRFDRALKPAKRLELNLPATATISKDEFLEATTDLWELPTESATRVGHPAPFPVELPRRLIDLYTYEGDVVLDPFMGSGSTAVAAVQMRRGYVGYDTDAGYVAAAEARIATARLAEAPQDTGRLWLGELTESGAVPAGPPDQNEDFFTRSLGAGLSGKEFAKALLAECGFGQVQSDVRMRGLGVEFSLSAQDAAGREWVFDVSGGLSTTGRSGLRSADNLWKALAKAAVYRQAARPSPLVLLTSDLPARGSDGAAALAALRGENKPVFDVIELPSRSDAQRLREYAAATTANP